MRPGTFERVYAAIRQQLRDGVFRPGERLEPAALAEQLNASVTPVRDALHRLVGERLVEAPRNEGFRVPLVTEVMLRHLYAWHKDLLLLALASRALEHIPDRGGPTYEDQLRIEREQRLFVALADATGNFEHAHALRALLERLQPYQRMEEELLDALEAETAAIARAIRSGDRRELRRLLLAYHRRRNRVVPELIEIVNRRSDHDLQ